RSGGRDEEVSRQSGSGVAEIAALGTADYPVAEFGNKKPLADKVFEVATGSGATDPHLLGDFFSAEITVGGGESLADFAQGQRVDAFRRLRFLRWMTGMRAQQAIHLLLVQGAPCPGAGKVVAVFLQRLLETGQKNRFDDVIEH